MSRYLDRLEGKRLEQAAAVRRGEWGYDRRKFSWLRALEIWSVCSCVLALAAVVAFAIAYCGGWLVVRAVR